MASRAAKPDGLLAVPPDGEREFLFPLPVERIWGVGPATAARLHAAGITTVGDIALASEQSLVADFGDSTGRWLHALARFRDPATRRRGRGRRSFGSQSALGRRRRSRGELDNVLCRLVERVTGRMRKAGRSGRTVVLRLRFDDYSRATRSVTLPRTTAATDAILRPARGLLDDAAPTIASGESPCSGSPSRTSTSRAAGSSSSCRSTATEARRSTRPSISCASGSARPRSPAARRVASQQASLTYRGEPGRLTLRSRRTTETSSPISRHAFSKTEYTGSAAARPWTSPGSAGFLDTARGMSDRNVLGEPLEPCGTDPVTGFYRDGCCRSDAEDVGSHTICAVVTEEFLEHQRSIGNDLTTAIPQYGFPGLVPGDRWCVTALNWLRAYDDGAAAFVVLAATHERALEIVPLEALRELAVDVPSDPGALAE